MFWNRVERRVCQDFWEGVCEVRQVTDRLYKQVTPVTKSVSHLTDMSKQILQTVYVRSQM